MRPQLSIPLNHQRINPSVIVKTLINNSILRERLVVPAPLASKKVVVDAVVFGPAEALGTYVKLVVLLVSLLDNLIVDDVVVTSGVEVGIDDGDGVVVVVASASTLEGVSDVSTDVVEAGA